MEYVELVTIWVCDGTQQSQFQQTFFDIPSDDSNIFHSSLASLQLQVNIRSNKNILWQNPTPSSTHFCRPIRIRFLREIVDITKKEIKYVEDQAKDLKKTEILTSNGVIYVRHTLLPTIVDAKVCNSATMKCHTCGKTSKHFNDFENTYVENPDTISDPETAAEISGIDLTLIQKLKIILEALSSGHKIDEIKFTEFAKETARLYTNLYEWHPMPSTLHKIFVHGATVIKHAIIPIGQMSEEETHLSPLYYDPSNPREFSRADVFTRHTKQPRMQVQKKKDIHTTGLKKLLKSPKLSTKNHQFTKLLI
ncbi:hypothetical protein ILUMI_17478 [Ignelater luminosus]|uniref:Uncharacterized protein n=1 Tax=Ignelater luminosus TaxID=2038154 RepID=A0A8K0CK16_IGNLU|nr:hypothetical protein ILUMI_17478 [Ignelater luminosus]